METQEQARVVPSTPEVPETPGVPEARRMIWGDCPACAYKHLAAAYAALTASPARGWRHADPDEIMAARAFSLMREAFSGYPGNVALACGCLANAELTAELNGSRRLYRGVRLAIMNGDAAMLDETDAIGFSAESLAAAHLTEALRELPELGDRAQWGRWLTFGGGLDCGNLEELLETLRRQLLWLSETYEIGKLEAK